MTSVSISRRAAHRLAAGHLWVYNSEVTDAGRATPGESVRVRDPSRRDLGTAHYSTTSTIALRLLSRQAESIDQDFFRRRLAAALEHRRQVRDSEAFRLCHAEGDLLPGLVIDHYAGYLVVQTLSQGMDRCKDEITAALVELVAPKGILLRNDAPRRERENLAADVRTVHGEVPETVPVRMNGLLFNADLIQGQKTGLFLDQRENYRAAARHARGRALDCFTSTGGFAMHLAPACESVEAVDSSARAIETARRNADANQIPSIHFREADVFDLLTGYAVTGRRYDTIVLDPPAFAKSRSAVQKALGAYREINFRALQVLATGGVLVTCSCSHHISEQMLLDAVTACAAKLGRFVRVIERRYQSIDHPVLLGLPETLYLKCLILQAL